MNIALPPELEKRVADKVAGGEYPSAEAMVREGLRRLFAQEERLAILRAKIQEGVDSVERGELMDAEEFFAELEQEALASTKPRHDPHPAFARCATRHP